MNIILTFFIIILIVLICLCIYYIINLYKNHENYNTITQCNINNTNAKGIIYYIKKDDYNKDTSIYNTHSTNISYGKTETLVKDSFFSGLKLPPFSYALLKSKTMSPPYSSAFLLVCNPFSKEKSQLLIISFGILNDNTYIIPVNNNYKYIDLNNWVPSQDGYVNNQVIQSFDKLTIKKLNNNSEVLLNLNLNNTSVYTRISGVSYSGDPDFAVDNLSQSWKQLRSKNTDQNSKTWIENNNFYNFYRNMFLFGNEYPDNSYWHGSSIDKYTPITPPLFSWDNNFDSITINKLLDPTEFFTKVEQINKEIKDGTITESNTDWLYKQIVGPYKNNYKKDYMPKNLYQVLYSSKVLYNYYIQHINNNNDCKNKICNSISLNFPLNNVYYPKDISKPLEVNEIIQNINCEKKNPFQLNKIIRYIADYFYYQKEKDKNTTLDDNALLQINSNAHLPFNINIPYGFPAKRQDFIDLLYSYSGEYNSYCSDIFNYYCLIVYNQKRAENAPLLDTNKLYTDNIENDPPQYLVDFIYNSEFNKNILSYELLLKQTSTTSFTSFKNDIFNIDFKQDTISIPLFMLRNITLVDYVQKNNKGTITYAFYDNLQKIIIYCKDDDFKLYYIKPNEVTIEEIKIAYDEEYNNEIYLYVSNPSKYKTRYKLTFDNNTNQENNPYYNSNKQKSYNSGTIGNRDTPEKNVSVSTNKGNCLIEMKFPKSSINIDKILFKNNGQLIFVKNDNDNNNSVDSSNCNFSESYVKSPIFNEECTYMEVISASDDKIYCKNNNYIVQVINKKLTLGYNLFYSKGLVTYITSPKNNKVTLIEDFKKSYTKFCNNINGYQYDERCSCILTEGDELRNYINQRYGDGGKFDIYNNFKADRKTLLCTSCTNITSNNYSPVIEYIFNEEICPVKIQGLCSELVRISDSKNVNINLLEDCSITINECENCDYYKGETCVNGKCEKFNKIVYTDDSKIKISDPNCIKDKEKTTFIIYSKNEISIKDKDNNYYYIDDKKLKKSNVQKKVKIFNDNNTDIYIPTGENTSKDRSFKIVNSDDTDDTDYTNVSTDNFVLTSTYNNSTNDYTIKLYNLNNDNEYIDVIISPLYNSCQKCPIDFKCEDKEYCFNGKCVKGCKKDSDCVVKQKRCLLGKCVDCITTNDCLSVGDGFECRNNSCIRI